MSVIPKMVSRLAPRQNPITRRKPPASTQLTSGAPYRSTSAFTSRSSRCGCFVLLASNKAIQIYRSPRLFHVGILLRRSSRPSPHPSLRPTMPTTPHNVIAIDRWASILAFEGIRPISWAGPTVFYRAPVSIEKQYLNCAKQISQGFSYCLLPPRPINKAPVFVESADKSRIGGKMESRWRRPPVFKNPTLLQVLPDVEHSTDLRTKVGRLEEAVRRLSVYTYIARQPDSETVAAELRFIEQTLYGIRRLTQHPTNRWPCR
jgi:hypothetical protein